MWALGEDSLCQSGCLQGGEIQDGSQTIGLSPSEVVPDEFLVGVEHYASIERRGVLERHIREVG